MVSTSKGCLGACSPREILKTRCEDGKVVLWCGTQASSHHVECVIDCCIDDAGVYTATLEEQDLFGTMVCQEVDKHKHMLQLFLP